MTTQKAIEYTAQDIDSGLRIDVALARAFPCYSRSNLQKVIKQKFCTVNGIPVSSSFLLTKGDTVRFTPIVTTQKEIKPQQISLSVIFEDEAILVINKPAGMVVHPAAGNWEDTVANAVLGRLSGTRLTRAGIVHRLDKDTSGIMIIAKNEAIQRRLEQAFKNREVEKRYLALVWGRLKTKDGIIDAPIGRSKNDRKKMGISPKGRVAITYFTVIREYKTKKGEIATLLTVSPKTGRTHQIRVHLKAMGNPVVGDKAYGRHSNIDKKLGRQFLHAAEITVQPGISKTAHFTAPLAPELEHFLLSLSAIE